MISRPSSSVSRILRVQRFRRFSTLILSSRDRRHYSSNDPERSKSDSCTSQVWRVPNTRWTSGCFDDCRFSRSDIRRQRASTAMEGAEGLQERVTRSRTNCGGDAECCCRDVRAPENRIEETASSPHHRSSLYFLSLPPLED